MIIEPRGMLEAARLAADHALEDADFLIEALHEDNRRLRSQLDDLRRLIGLDVTDDGR